MGKYAYLNLRQKMVKIRKMVPKLLRKRYSEEVPYDFVKLDDIYEYLAPAMNKYGVDFEILDEIATLRDEAGEPVYLMSLGDLWRYEADLKLCWINADHPEEKQCSEIHVVGTNEVPDKAKGAAWSYGLKYYLLNKYNIVQANTDDPDMRGPAPDGDKTKKEKKEEKSEESREPTKKQVSETNTVKSEPKKKEAKEKTDYPPKSAVSTASAEEIKQPLKPKEKLTLKTVRNGNAVSNKKAAEISEDSFDLEISPDEVRDLQENDENLPGQMQFGMDEYDLEDKTLAFEEDAVEENVEETESPSEADDLEVIPEEVDEEEFHLVDEEDENPFEDEEEVSLMESGEDKVENAKKIICNFGLFSGKSLGEMMQSTKGAETVRWMATNYHGSNVEMVKAAKIIVEHEKQDRLAA